MDTKKSVLDRREELFERMLDGDTPTKLKEQWMFRNSNKTKHSYDKDITWCYNKLAEFGEDNTETIIKQHVIMYDKNIKEARELGAIGAANQAMQYKEKLLGLHKPDTVVNVQNNIVNVESLSLEQVEKLLDASK